MPAVQYPFIDIAVHEGVRKRFANGEAMALFSMDLKSALWANGSGAALFGASLIYDFLDRGPSAQDVTFRQFAAAASRLRKVGDRQQFSIRVFSGFKSIAVQAVAEVIEAERGVPTILFAAALNHQPLTVTERARQMIAGFDDAFIHMAVLDDNGSIVAASKDFAGLAITPQTTKTLISMAAGQPSKLVKRPVPTGKGYLPAATAQLSEEPSLNLLFVVETALGKLDPSDDFAEQQPKATKPEAVDTDLAFASVLDAVAEIEDVAEPEDIGEVDEGEEARPALTQAVIEYEEEPASHHEHDQPLQLEADFDAAIAQEQEEPVPFDAPGIEDVPETEIALPAPFAELKKTDQPGAENDTFVFNKGGRASRFVWKIDSSGRFSSISSEFASAVGPKAAAVEGMNFSDLAALFSLDPEGKIAELLNRRDTWSGKTIYWPVEGTSLVVPIDLAALPTYTRSREFDGFRGFGIVRIADAVEDPNAVGLTLSGQDPDDAGQAAEAVIIDEANLFSLPTEEEDVAAVEPVAETSSPEAVEDVAKENASSNYAPPAEEVAALRIVETPGRRSSDKLVQLEDHRANRRDRLTASEQAAFREIGRTLKSEEGDAQEDSAITSTVVADVASASVADADAHEASLHDENIEISPEVVVDEPSATKPEAEADDFADYTRGDEAVVFSLLPLAHSSEPQDEDDAELDLEPEFLTIDAAQSGAGIEQMAKPADAHPRSALSITEGILDQMPIALLVHNGDTLIHANPEFLRMTGYASLSDLSDVGGLDALLQRDDLESISDQTGGMVAVSAENDLIPVRAKLQSIRWHEISALMLSLIPAQSHEDISPAGEETPTVTAEQVPDIDLSRMKGEIEELHSILETATDGVVLLGEDGNIRSLNRSASALFNYDAAEITHKPFVTLFAHESQRAVLDYLSGLSNNGVASVLNDGREVIGREASGGFLPLFMTIGRLKSTNGYCAVIRDITQWKRTEEDLRNAKRAAETANAHKTDFLARVSHEIRTPLNAIIGFADMMATERFGPVGHPRYIEYSNDIVRSGRHVLDIVNDLLDISKIEAGQMDVDFRAVALNDTIAEAVSLVQPQANNQRVIIRTALSQSVPQIVADLRSIKQILLNILSNAIKFTPSGGQIVVSTAYEANGSVTLRIRDTGIGMTRVELEQAMKPFRQVSASGSRMRGDGTGLGLPLTKAMVEANRANFSITSMPNEGTLVEISFPSQRVLAN